MGVRFPPSGFTDRTAARAGVRYASWLRRFGAAVIDALLVYTINYILITLYSLSVGAVLLTSYRVYLVITIVLASTSIVYATLCLAKLDGQTPGMRVLQVRCTALGNRRRITIPQALTRSLVAAPLTSAAALLVIYKYLPPVPDTALFVIAAISWFWPLIDQRRQTWWDHLAATVVMDDRGW